jgi:hypothetical protein
MSSIRDQVRRIVRNKSWSDADILALLNRGVTQISAGMMFTYDYGVPGAVSVLSPPLPDLATQTGAAGMGSDGSTPLPDLTTDPVNPYIALPADFQRDLYFLYSVTNGYRILNLFPTFVEFQSYYPMLNLTCQVIGAARRGTQLWYQGVPPGTEVLRPFYYRLPVPVTEEAVDTPPDGIPAHLQEELLINWASMKIWTEIESGVGAQLVMTRKYEERLNKALMDLDAFCPAQREPVVMAPDYDRSYFD